MNENILKNLIKGHEGYKEAIYLDSVRVPSGGFGHAFLIGSTLPDYIWEEIFEHDYKNALNNALDYAANHRLQLDAVRFAVIVDMMFNLGYGGVMKFKNMRAALIVGDYNAAAEEMLDSKWARQVGKRAIELANMMQTGEWGVI